HVTDFGIGKIATSCPSLLLLSLNNCPSITNAGIWAIGRHCRQLRELSLESCRALNDEAFSPTPPVMATPGSSNGSQPFRPTTPVSPSPLVVMFPSLLSL